VSRLAEARAFDVLVPVCLDRLARKNHLRRLYEEWLEKQGITVEFAQQKFEDTASSRLHKGITGEFTEYETEVIRQRTMEKRRKKAEGRRVMPVNAATYGYHQITKAEAAVLPQYRGRDGEQEVVESEAAVVRLIFELYAAGSSIRAVATRLRDAEHRTRKGGIFAPGTIRVILRNEAYVGRLYYGKETCRNTDELTANRQIRCAKTNNPRESWVELPCSAIISEDLFQAVQLRMAENQETLRGRPSDKWPLAGVVFCGDCTRLNGESHLRCRGKSQHSRGCETRYYRCGANYRLDRQDCSTRIRADKLEGMAMVALRMAAEPGRLAEFERQQAMDAQAAAGDPTATMARLERDLADVQAKQGQLLDAALSALFPQDVLQRKTTELAAQRERLTRELSAARTQAARMVTPDAAAARGEAAADYLRRALPLAEVDPVRLRELFRLFLEIHLYPGKAEPEILTRVPAGLPVLEN
jgi:site-specific DNA recombinase